MFLVTTGDAVTAPESRAVVSDLVARLQDTTGVEEVIDPYANAMVSADGRAVLVRVTMSR